jgi:hypothetical protein
MCRTTSALQEQAPENLRLAASHWILKSYRPTISIYTTEIDGQAFYTAYYV